MTVPQQSKSSILLLETTGPDRPGVTHSLTDRLAHAGGRILDAGQAVIHNSLALGILVEVEDHSDGLLLRDLKAEAAKLGVELRCREITADEYAGWVARQSKQRFSITLLGPAITARHLADASGIVARAGLNIDRIDRLSGRIVLGPVPASSRVCFELGASGPMEDEETLRAELMELAATEGIDVSFQHDSIFRRNRRLVAFDMDSTLIAAEVIDELAKLAGRGAEVQQITELAMRGELDFQSSFRKRVSLLKGIPEQAVHDLAGRVPLMEGAKRLTSTLKRLGYKMAILSGGFTFVGERLCAELGVDHLHANVLDIRDGAVTGEVSDPIVDGQEKANRLKQIAATEGWSMEQVIAGGDGANDLPMLRIAGLGIAFRAKPVVRQNARQAISHMGLDGILYLLGVRDREAETQPAS